VVVYGVVLVVCCVMLFVSCVLVCWTRRTAAELHLLQEAQHAARLARGAQRAQDRVVGDAAGRRLRRPLGSWRRFPPQAPRCI